MKLIDLLVQELPKRGGWPEGAVGVVQDARDGELYFFIGGPVVHAGDSWWFGENKGASSWIFHNIEYEIADDHATAIVTREQYEAALAASDGWVLFTGDNPPEHGVVTVDVKRRDGGVSKGVHAIFLRLANAWKITDHISDIIAYRPHKQDSAAAQQPVWNGEGIPPVGCECEFYNGERYYTRDSSPQDGQKVKVVHHEISGAGIPCAVFVWIGDDKSVKSEAAQAGLFRPLRTEADKKRDAAVHAMASTPKPCGHAIHGICCEIYDAIAAGKIPGVKLSD